MARGTQDFGSIVSTIAANQIDTGEIGYLLSGVGLLDGLGRTVIFDNFRNGLGTWAIANTGSGVVPEVITAQYDSKGHMFVPPFDILFDGGVVAGGTSSIVRRFFLGSLGKVGFEAGISLAHTCADLIASIIYGLDGFTWYKAAVKISVKDGIITALNSAGVYQYITSISPDVANTEYPIQFKFVVDFNKGKYVRFLLGQIKYDISATAPQTIVSVDAGWPVISLSGTSRGVTYETVKLGYARITLDEP